MNLSDESCWFLRRQPMLNKPKKPNEKKKDKNQTQDGVGE